MAILAECPFCRKKQSVRNKLCNGGADLDRLKRNQKIRYWITYRLPGGTQRREPVIGEELNPYSVESAREMHSKRVVQKTGMSKMRACRIPEKKSLLTANTIKSLVVKVLGGLGYPKRLIFLVPEVGLEPTRAQGPLDFESSASTSFTTPA